MEMTVGLTTSWKEIPFGHPVKTMLMTNDNTEDIQYSFDQTKSSGASFTASNTAKVPQKMSIGIDKYDTEEETITKMFAKIMSGTGDLLILYFPKRS